MYISKWHKKERYSMTYIYAYSNHKENLDRIRRMAVLYKRLEAEGESVTMLTNNFRAVSIAIELGAIECTTIETIMDIDFIAKDGDSIVIDSPEDDRGRLELYMQKFASVSRVISSENEVSIYGEELLDIDGLVDDYYHAVAKEPKIDRRVLFWGDSDSSKSILRYREYFSDLSLELLLGEYFFPKYESEISDIFTNMHDSEDYRDVIGESSYVATSSVQSAIEASIAGAIVEYIAILPLLDSDKSRLEKHDISIKYIENSIVNQH